jgi:hypothetical protein
MAKRGVDLLEEYKLHHNILNEEHPLIISVKLNENEFGLV